MQNGVCADLFDMKEQTCSSFLCSINTELCDRRLNAAIVEESILHYKDDIYSHTLFLEHVNLLKWKM